MAPGSAGPRAMPRALSPRAAACGLAGAPRHPPPAPLSTPRDGSVDDIGFLKSYKHFRLYGREK